MEQPVPGDLAVPRDDASCTGRLFLIHISLDACPSSGQYRGRVQHVRSSDAAHFGTLEELAAFMRMRIEALRDGGGG